MDLKPLLTRTRYLYERARFAIMKPALELTGSLPRALSFRPIFITISASTIFLVGFTAYYKFFLGKELYSLEPKSLEQIGYWGQLGDFFGGTLNPLLSFMALIAVLHSIRIQSNELKEAREETKLANKIQKRQAAVFERQTFESVFFRLLDAHGKITSDIKKDIGGITFIHGVFFTTFHVYREKFKEKIDHSMSRFGGHEGGESLPNEIKQLIEADVSRKAFIESAQEHFDSRCDERISIYLRSLYQLLKLIDDAHFDTSFDDNNRPSYIRRVKRDYYVRRQYSNILRAQLTSDELAVIFFNCASSAGAGLKYYIEKYSVFKHFKLSEHKELEIIKDLYHDLAYQDYAEIKDYDLGYFYREKTRKVSKDML